MRLTAQLEEPFARWSKRDHSRDRRAIVFLDSLHLAVRMMAPGLAGGVAQTHWAK